MPGRSMKQRRADELLRTVIAEEVAELKDPRLGFVTVTAVETSADLHSAVIFYSVLGDDSERAETAKALDSAAPRIRSRVGSRVDLRYVPTLEFRIDEAVESGIRISQILAELEESRTEEEPDPGPS